MLLRRGAVLLCVSSFAIACSSAKKADKAPEAEAQMAGMAGMAGMSDSVKIPANAIYTSAMATAQFLAAPSGTIPMVGASGAISALFGLYALFFGRPKQVTRNQKLNRSIHVAWLLVTWVALQWMAAYLV